MAKTYIENIKHTAVRNKIFSLISVEKQQPIFEVIKLSSGDYLPATAMVDGDYIVYGGGGQTNKNHTQFNVPKRTFGIGRVGARCGCVFEIQPKSWVTDNALFAMGISSEYDINFLIEYLNFKNINQFANTSAQPVISLKRMSNITIPIVDLDRQKEIVEILRNFEKGDFNIQNDKYGIKSIIAIADVNGSLSIELSQQLNLVKKLREQLLQDAIQGKLVPQNPDDEPASVLLQKIKAEKEQLIKEKKLKKGKELAPIKPEEIPFEIPETWVWVRLGQISEIVRGGSPRPAGDPRFYGGDIPFLKVGDLTGFEGVYCNSYTYSIKEAGLKKTRFVEANTLMLTNSGATLGVPRICTFPTTFNDGIAALLNLISIDKIYLFYFLRSKSEWFLKQASRGQGQPNLNTDIIADTIFPLPPIEEQYRIVQKVEKLLQTCDELEASIKQSHQQNEQLLQQVLREALNKEVALEL